MFLNYKNEFLPYKGHIELLIKELVIEFKTVSNKDILVQYNTQNLAELEFLRVKELIRVNSASEDYVLDVNELIKIAEADSGVTPNPDEKVYPYVDGIPKDIRMVEGDRVITKDELTKDIRIIYSAKDETKEVKVRMLAEDEIVTEGTILTSENIIEELKKVQSDVVYHLESDIIVTEPIYIYGENITIYGNDYTVSNDTNVIFDKVDSNLVNAMGKGLQVLNTSFIAHENIKSAMHVYSTTNCTFTDCKFIKTGNNGCAIVNNGSEIKFSGNIDIVISPDAWKGIDVDSKIENKIPTLEFDPATVTTFYNDINSDGEVFFNPSKNAFIDPDSDDYIISDIPGFSKDEDGEIKPIPSGKFNINLTCKNYVTSEEVLLVDACNTRGSYSIEYLIIDDAGNVFNKTSKLLVDGKLIMAVGQVDLPTDLSVRVDILKNQYYVYDITPLLMYLDFTGGLNYVHSLNKISVKGANIGLFSNVIQYIHPTRAAANNLDYTYLTFNIFIHGNIEFTVFPDSITKVYTCDKTFDLNQFISTIKASMKYVDDLGLITDRDLEVSTMITPLFDITKLGKYKLIATATAMIEQTVRKESITSEIFVLQNDIPSIRLTTSETLKTLANNVKSLFEGVIVTDRELGDGVIIPKYTIIDSKDDSIISEENAFANIGKYIVKYEAEDNYQQQALPVERNLFVVSDIICPKKLQDIDIKANGDIISTPIAKPYVDVRSLIATSLEGIYYINQDNMRITIVPTIEIDGIETDFINLNSIQKHVVAYTMVHPEIPTSKVTLTNNIYVHGHFLITAKNFVVNKSDETFDIDTYKDNELDARCVTVAQDGTLTTQIVDTDTLARTSTPVFDITKSGEYRLTYSYIDTRFEPEMEYKKTVTLTVTD